ncbi:MAG: hypothetical protein A3F84_03200 [Candidatus Handelsmanbacteria bacterium RIFCSPLOWO2_12_FULL_64_10]|uniref:PIN domain-containing protein n=1 Tax=Handelsmanbacteria sp. (strain RIFCSPLOWO2_12_FULL_64_10) TaxID=1817868 RepID=A0A1F6CBK2_HANXR|nr:MAG: hypothetical protein A3F84_03200 [Candidatus Handelsmanbacteria bacterium RIFCSPLOWO2_12_FULL_64_10]
MPARRSRRLVIDASVAGTSGEKNERGQRCRDFLNAVREICHHVVMTSEIEAEWKRHSHLFARQWQRSMTARRKVRFVNLIVDDELRGKIGRTAARDRDREAMLKDVLLIEAARETDHTVISLDETARGLFGKAARSVGELRNIVWVNPEAVDERPISWLENGAKPEKGRRLGSGSG